MGFVPQLNLQDRLRSSLFSGRSAWVVIEDIGILTHIFGNFGQTCVSIGDRLTFKKVVIKSAITIRPASAEIFNGTLKFSQISQGLNQ